MNSLLRVSALLGLALIGGFGVLTTPPGYCDNSAYPVIYRLPTHDKYPVVFRLVTPGKYVDDVTIHAPVTKPGDPVPLPQNVKKVRKY